MMARLMPNMMVKRVLKVRIWSVPGVEVLKTEHPSNAEARAECFI